MKRFIVLVSLLFLFIVPSIVHAQTSSEILTKQELTKHFDFISVANSNIEGLMVIEVQVTGKKQKPAEFSNLLVTKRQKYYMVFASRKILSKDWVKLRKTLGFSNYHKIFTSNKKEVLINIDGIPISLPTHQIAICSYGRGITKR